MTSIEIRPCEMRDLPAVRDLMIQLSEAAHATNDFELTFLAELFQRMARTPEIYLNYAAVADGQVVGFVSVIFYQTFFHRGGTALINELIVNREQRGSGIGRALVKRVVDEALARGMDEVEVGTETDNQAARRFYHRAGFDEEYVLLGTELTR
ncbi:MAG: GNAT family N-acetyltransferase [Chloroflexi bacterium]|nr:GNAT family N-acetyltransferase [Chloroflexota bacterium]